jgi:hypothetical protein
MSSTSIMQPSTLKLETSSSLKQFPNVNSNLKVACAILNLEIGLNLDISVKALILSFKLKLQPQNSCSVQEK